MTIVCVQPAGADDYLDIPKPTDRLAPPPAPPNVEPSVLSIPAKVSLQELLVIAADSFPEVMENEGAWHEGPPIAGQPPFQWQYRLHRGPVQVQINNNHLEAVFPDIRYRVAVRAVKPGGEIEDSICGYKPDEPRHMSITVRSNLQWADDWTVRSTTAFDEPVFPDPCASTAAGADVSTIVKAAVHSRLPVLGKKIDERIQEGSQRRRGVEKAWRTLLTPTELAPELWLNLRPGTIQAGPIMGNNEQQVVASLNLLLEPVVTTGSMPPVQERPLPPLQLTSGGQDGFHLAIPVMVDYDWINVRLRRQLVGQEIPMSIGDPIFITSARLYGSGSQLILAMGVRGSVKGTLYAGGKPVIDPVTHILRFDGFDFTMDTRNILVRTANWLLRDNILDTIEPQTRIDLSGQMASMRQALDKALHREVLPGAWINGAVSKLEPKGIYPIEGGVEAQVVADGTIELLLPPAR
ncbi:DUF4403 family protein [Nitrospira japonica]|nr:DUF4403 family protein [Nitrospira japonica]